MLLFLWLIYYLYVVQYFLFFHNPLILSSINCFSASLTSSAKSLTATDEHFLDLIFFVLDKNLEIPIHSPNNAPFSTLQTGI